MYLANKLPKNHKTKFLTVMNKTFDVLKTFDKLYSIKNCKHLLYTTKVPTCTQITLSYA